MDERERLINSVRDARAAYDDALAAVAAASARLAGTVWDLERHELAAHRPGARARVAAALDLSWQQVARHVARAKGFQQPVDTISL
jgi:hypothetical protein